MVGHNHPQLLILVLKRNKKNGSYPVQISVHRLAGPVQSPSRFCTYPNFASSYLCSEFSKKNTGKSGPYYTWRLLAVASYYKGLAHETSQRWYAYQCKQRIFSSHFRTKSLTGHPNNPISILNKHVYISGLACLHGLHAWP